MNKFEKIILLLILFVSTILGLIVGQAMLNASTEIRVEDLATSYLVCPLVGFFIGGIIVITLIEKNNERN